MVRFRAPFFVTNVTARTEPSSNYSSETMDVAIRCRDEFAPFSIRISILAAETAPCPRDKQLPSKQITEARASQTHLQNPRPPPCPAKSPPRSPRMFPARCGRKSDPCVQFADQLIVFLQLAGYAQNVGLRDFLLESFIRLFLSLPRRDGIPARVAEKPS